MKRKSRSKPNGFLVSEMLMALLVLAISALLLESGARAMVRLQIPFWSR